MITPASATTYRSGAFTSSTRVMRSSETTIAFSSAFAPPESPVPAPRATTLSPSAAANRTTAATSSVVSASTTASGRWNSAHSASSCA